MNTTSTGRGSGAGQLVRTLKPDGSFWLAIGDDFAAELKLIFQQELGSDLPLSWVIWRYYTFGVNCKFKFSRSHTHIFHFVKNPRASRSTPKRNSGAFRAAAGLCGHAPIVGGGCRMIHGSCGPKDAPESFQRGR